MEHSLIESVVKKRALNMTEINEKDIEKVIHGCNKILDFCRENEIDFDETAGIVFITHITSFYERAKKNEYVEVESELFSELDDDLFEIAQKTTKLMENYFNCSVPKDEIMLIASHLGAMKARLETVK